MGARWLLDLPDVCRAAGLRTNTWPGWETRSRGSGGYNALHAVGVHHTASNTSPNNDMTYMWQNSPNEPVGAIYLARDGVVTIGAAGATNTQGKGGPWTNSKGQTTPLDAANSYWISIEAANAGTGEAWPVAQQDAYVTLCAALCDTYDLAPADVQAHFEWTNRKIDPAGNSRYATGGNKWNMPQFRGDVSAAMGSGPPPGDDEVTALQTPIRWFDSRSSGDRWIKNLSHTITLPASIGNPAQVQLNLTVVDGATNGYLRAWTGPEPETSNVNFGARDAISNLALVKVGADRKINFRPNQDCHVICDIQGA